MDCGDRSASRGAAASLLPALLFVVSRGVLRDVLFVMLAAREYAGRLGAAGGPCGIV
jgi:hypothetical protein